MDNISVNKKNNQEELKNNSEVIKNNPDVIKNNSEVIKTIIFTVLNKNNKLELMRKIQEKKDKKVEMEILTLKFDQMCMTSVISSDDETENIMKGLKHFRHNKQEIIVFHIMDRKELDFNFTNRTKFKDMETDEQITTEPWKIRKIYQQSIQSYQDELRLRCREQKIDYVPLFTDQNLDLALNEFLKKRQRLG